MKKGVILLLLLFIFINTTVFAADTSTQKSLVDVSAPNAVLIDMDTGKIIYQKDAYTPVYPASTTKVLTAILTLENCNLDDEVTASYEAVNSVYADGTIANIQSR